MDQAPQPQPLTLDKEFERLLSDPDIRKQLRRTLKGFGLLYFPHHLYLPPGEHHPAMIEALEDGDIEFLEIIGFRGCSKTTWSSLITPSFFALEKPEEYPFILLGSDTALQGGINIANIKRELETNELLKQDYGTFRLKDVDDAVPEPSFESEEEWQARNLLLSNDVRILARSRGQKVRGLKHRQWRPRAVFLDDPEDSDWVKTKENRDKTEQWLNSEVIPGLDKQKKKLVISINMLHMDGLAARVKAKGTFKVLEFPLVNDADEWQSCLWKAQYPDQASIDAARKNAGPIAWEREYKLKVVAEDGAIITPEDIHYYDEKPKTPAQMKGHGIDLAISTKEGADYTTIVSGEVFYEDGGPKIFVRPDPYNEHVTFHDFMTRVREIPGEMKGANIFFVEDVQYQKAAIQEMERMMLPVVPMRPQGDKRARLQVVAPYIKNGTVLFPRSGCEQLLAQLFNLGVEAHDDLCLVGDTRVVTDRGEAFIRDIRAGDRVLTRQGYKRVRWAGQTGNKEVITRFGLTGTPNHPVITGRGVIHLANVSASDIVYMCRPSSSHIEEKRIGETRARSSERTGSISGAMTNGRKPLARSIGTCGSTLTGLFRKAWSSITRTAIRSTTALITSNSSIFDSICPTICASQSGASSPAGTCSGMSSLPPDHGIPRPKVRHGTAIMPSSSSETGGSIRSLASGAADCFSIGSELLDSAPYPASSAGSNTRVPVYNLLVEDVHEFFANGILVHNCDGLVYMIQGLANQGLELPKIHWIEG